MLQARNRKLILLLLLAALPAVHAAITIEPCGRIVDDSRLIGYEVCFPSQPTSTVSGQTDGVVTSTIGTQMDATAPNGIQIFVQGIVSRYFSGGTTTDCRRLGTCGFTIEYRVQDQGQQVLAFLRNMWAAQFPPENPGRDIPTVPVWKQDVPLNIVRIYFHFDEQATAAAGAQSSFVDLFFGWSVLGFGGSSLLSGSLLDLNGFIDAHPPSRARDFTLVATTIQNGQLPERSNWQTWKNRPILLNDLFTDLYYSKYRQYPRMRYERGMTEDRHLQIRVTPPEVVAATQATPQAPQTIAPGVMTASCGGNEYYVKFCYKLFQTTPFRPQGHLSSINTYLKETQGNVHLGYMLAVLYEERETEPLVRQRAEKLAHEVRQAQDILLGVNGIERKYPVAYVLVKRQPVQSNPQMRFEGEEDLISAYLFTDRQFVAANTQGAFFDPTGAGQGEAHRIGTALHNLYYTDGIPQTAIAAWRTHVENMNEAIAGLVKQIERKTAITVWPIYSLTPIPSHDETLLHAFLADRIRYACTPLTGTGTRFDGTTLAGELLDCNQNRGRPTELGGETIRAEDIRKPCRTYLLIDPEKIDVYQSRYCRLRIGSVRIDSKGTEHAAIELLRNALRNTERPEMETLFLQAHNLALSANAQEGLELADFVVERMKDSRQTRATREIIHASSALIQGTPQPDGESTTVYVLNTVNEHFAHVMPKFKPVAAELAMKAALREASYDEQGCKLIQETWMLYSSFVPGGATSTEANQRLRDCQLQRVRNTCTLLVPGQSQRYLDTHLIFVNDGIEEARFRELALDVQNRFYSMQNIRNYAPSPNRDPSISEFRIYIVEAANRITTSRGMSRNPIVDAKALELTRQGCPGHMYIVFSDQEFFPVTYAGTGIISTAWCAQDVRCMNIYTARSIAQILFRMPAEENTVTARLAGVDDRPLRELFNIEQQARIRRYMEEGAIG